MIGKRVIITVDRRKVTQFQDVLARLKREGLEVDQLADGQDLTHIFGRYDGDVSNLNSEGVVAEMEGWMSEM